MVLEFVQNNIAFIVFVIVLSFFLYIKRKNLEIQGKFPFLYMMLYKTKLGLDKMDKWSKKHPKVFEYLSYYSIFIGIVGMILAFVFMFWQLGYIVENQITAGGGLVLPIKTDSGMEGPVPVFYVPFWYWLIALFILAVVHEFAHGVIGERWGVRIKSSGFAFLGILAPIMPAAFVEPNEEDLAKKKWWQKIAVFGAGSASNLIFGLLFLLLWIFVAGPFVDSTMTVGSIEFQSVMNQSSLNDYGITNGKLLALDGNYDGNKILERLSTMEVNESLILTIESGEEINDYEIKTFENPNYDEKGMIGISGLNYDLVNKEGFELLGNVPLHTERVLFYVWFLNIAIALMNLLPLWITDGGQIARTLLSLKFDEKNTLRIYNLLSYVILVVIIFTVWPKLLFMILG